MDNVVLEMAYPITRLHTIPLLFSFHQHNLFIKRLQQISAFDLIALISTGVFCVVSHQKISYCLTLNDTK
jgi:hypothetical protein